MGENGEQPPSLNFEAKWDKDSEVLSIAVHKGVIGTSLAGRDAPTIGDSHPIAEYQKTIDASIDDFLGAQADAILRSGK